MDFIGLINPMYIIKGREGYTTHAHCRDRTRPTRTVRNSSMLTKDQRSGPDELVSNLTPSHYQLSWADLEEGVTPWDLWSTKKMNKVI
jgi:hypothetical protein